MKKDPVKELVTPNYVKKTITIRPDKKNGLLKFDQIKTYSDNQLKKLPTGAKMIVRGENILGDRTLKSYEGAFETQEEHDKYAMGRVVDAQKFDKYYNFTITIVLPK